MTKKRGKKNQVPYVCKRPPFTIGHRSAVRLAHACTEGIRRGRVSARAHSLRCMRQS